MILQKLQYKSRSVALISALIFSATSASGLAANQLNPQNEHDPVSIYLHLDRTEAMVADPITLQVIALSENGVVVEFPKLGDTLGPFQVIRVRDTLDLPDANGRKSIRSIVLESLEAGELFIPPMEIQYVDRRNDRPSTGQQSTPQLTVTIRSTLEGVQDPTQFRDIKAVLFQLEPEPRKTFAWGWLVATTGLVVVIAGAVVVTRRRKTVQSPTRWARNAIRELQESRVFQEHQAEQVYVRLAEIVRQFINREFEISAPRLTTAEFLSEVLSDKRMSDEFHERLAEFMNLADLVKFAAMVPDEDNLHGMVAQARHLIEIPRIDIPNEFVDTPPREAV